MTDQIPLRAGQVAPTAQDRIRAELREKLRPVDANGRDIANAAESAAQTATAVTN